ncbi:MAG: nucleotidyltransferase domain-containing protein [Deltaproteobacteria bacterium]|nr:nucleotidyltransferase domain-containing protein [Deltaproteobacteria bacterium]
MQRPNSDIDILVEFNRPIGMEIVDLVLELEKLLGGSVDLVSKKALKPELLKAIEQQINYV